MKKIYNENDEVEIRLKYYVNHTFVLEWRFKEPGRFLFFKVPDKWRRIVLYDNPYFSPNENPDIGHMYFLTLVGTERYRNTRDLREE